jgi:DNA-binding MarR family transcriptional regulator
VPIDDVVELLDRWRSVGGVRRSRVLVDGVRLFAGLTPEERRLVAQSLTEAGAPGLADAVASRTGTEVRPEQLQELTGRLLDLDRRQLDELVDTLSDPAERHRLARVATEQALELPGSSAPPPQGPAFGEGWVPDRVGLRQEDLDALPPPGEAAREVGAVATPGSDRDLSGIAGLHAIALGQLPPDDPVLGDLALDHPGLQEVSLGSTDLHDIGIYDGLSVHEIRLATERGSLDGPHPADSETPAVAGPAPRAHDGVEPDHEPREHHALHGPHDEGDHGDHGDHHDERDERADDHHEPDDEPPTQAPAGGGSAAAALAAAADARAARGARLVAELQDAASAPQRFACLRRAGLDGLPPDASLAALDAVPAGWQRRRLATRLVAAGSLPTEDLADLFGRFPARADTVFLAGELVDAGLVSPEALASLLPPQDARRLAVRGER